MQSAQRIVLKNGWRNRGPMNICAASIHPIIFGPLQGQGCLLGLNIRVKAVHTLQGHTLTPKGQCKQNKNKLKNRFLDSGRWSKLHREITQLGFEPQPSSCEAKKQTTSSACSSNSIQLKTYLKALYLKKQQQQQNTLQFGALHV